MPYKCYGLCDHEKSLTGMRFYDPKTGITRKKCTTCQKSLRTDDDRCYCCRAKLQIGPMKMKYKMMQREIKRI